MKITQIKEKKIYLLRDGRIARAVRVDGAFPPSVELKAVQGIAWLGPPRIVVAPGEIEREIQGDLAWLEKKYLTRLVGGKT